MLHYPDLSATHAKNPDTFSGLSDPADTHETNNPIHQSKLQKNVLYENTHPALQRQDPPPVHIPDISALNQTEFFFALM